MSVQFMNINFTNKNWNAMVEYKQFIQINSYCMHHGFLPFLSLNLCKSTLRPCSRTTVHWRGRAPPWRCPPPSSSKRSGASWLWSWPCPSCWPAAECSWSRPGTGPRWMDCHLEHHPSWVVTYPSSLHLEKNYKYIKKSLFQSCLC